MLHFLFSEGRPGRCDELFADQQAAVAAFGHTTSLVTNGGQVGILPAGRTLVYRGWMLTADEYRKLDETVRAASCEPLTSTDEYLATHHLPNWYPLLTDLTPETRVFPSDADLAQELTVLGWDGYFVKDFVKSLKTGRGSIIRDLADAMAVVAELRDSRGMIEGGLCVRRLEEFRPGSECRYFVLHGTPYAPAGRLVPPVVVTVASRLVSPFYSVDVAERADEVLRVVEVGDGQVSDLVGWSADEFAGLWAAR